MWNSLIAVLVALVLLVGCGAPVVDTPPEQSGSESPAVPTASPSVEEGAPAETPTSEGTESEGTVTWNDSPEAIVVQYDEGGGFRLPPSGTPIPLWTLYGDGTVLWSQDSEKPTPGFEREVFMGEISADEMAELLAFLAGSGVRQLEDVRDNMIADAPQARLLINIDDELSELTVYPPENAEAPAAFFAVRERLLSTRPDDSEPITADAFELQPEQQIALGELTEDQAVEYEWWPFEDLPLDELVGSSRALEGQQAVDVAQFVMENGNAVKYDTYLYRVGLFADPPRPVD